MGQTTSSAPPPYKARQYSPHKTYDAPAMSNAPNMYTQQAVAYQQAAAAAGYPMYAQNAVLPTKQAAPKPSNALVARKYFIYLVVKKHALEQDWGDLPVLYPNLYTANDKRFANPHVAMLQKAIDAMLRNEAQALKWKGPPSFLDVAHVAASVLVLESEYSNFRGWKEVTESWVARRMDHVGPQVFAMLGC